jgi:hypothetical protein
MASGKDSSAYLSKPYRTITASGSVVVGFDDLESAQADAAKRNDRASKLGVPSRYMAVAK